MLNKHNLNLANLACKEASRFTLDGILVTPSCTVVTDGHKLVKMDLPIMPEEGQLPLVGGLAPLRTWKPFVLERADALELAKAIPSATGRQKRSGHIHPILENAFLLERGETRVVFGVTTGGEDHRTFDFAILNGNFPDYERVIPREFPFTINLNLDYLKEIATVVGKSMYERGRCTSLDIRDNASAVAFRMTTEFKQQVIAVLMPMRADETQAIPGMVSEESSISEYPATAAVVKDLAGQIVHDVLVHIACASVQNQTADADELVQLVAKRLRGDNPSHLPPWVTEAIPNQSKEIH